MKKRNNIILILFIFSIICLISLHYLNYFENFNENKPDIGNMLSIYYSKLVYSILNKIDFDFNENISNFNNDFLNNLPNKIPYSTYEYLHNDLLNLHLSNEKINSLNNNGKASWLVNNSNDEKILFIMKPVIQKLFDDAFIKSGNSKTVNDPVIHFRCADTPFVRSNLYGFQKYCFFEKALKDAEEKLQRKFNNIILLSYVNHKSKNDDAEACNKYAKALKEYLESLNYSVTIQSNSQIDDLATIFYAPVSISTISSFSFMSGFFGKGLFITAVHGYDNSCDGCSGWIYKNFNLKDSTVDDYHNTETVVEMLKKCDG